MERRKRHAWSIACEIAVVTKEDAWLLYEKLMKQFEKLEPIETVSESNKSC